MTNGDAEIVRLAALERQQDRHDERLKSLERDLTELNDSMKSLRNAVLTFAFTVAGSAIAVLLALTQVAK